MNYWLNSQTCLKLVGFQQEFRNFDNDRHQLSVCALLKVSEEKPLAGHDWLQSWSRQRRKLQLLVRSLMRKAPLLLLLLSLHPPPTHLPFLHLQCSKIQLAPLLPPHLLQDPPHQSLNLAELTKLYVSKWESSQICSWYSHSVLMAKVKEYRQQGELIWLAPSFRRKPAIWCDGTSYDEAFLATNPVMISQKSWQ